jgi:quercetin dioxygenase-like cupin family protein
MSSVNRQLHGDVLVHRLPRDAMTIDTALVAKHGRSARTLVKEGPLRLTLLALAPDGNMPVHDADGPVSIQVLEGDVVFTVSGADHTLAAGDFIVFAAGVSHSVQSTGGCLLLLTVSFAGRDEAAQAR